MADGWLVSVELHTVRGSQSAAPHRGPLVIGPSEHLLMAAKDAGLRVAVLAHDPGQYDIRPGLVDRWIQLATSRAADIVDGVRRLPGRVDAITSSVDNFVGVTATAARHLGLPGPAVTSACIHRDKSLVRAALARAGVESVAWQKYDVQDDSTGHSMAYPFVAKPVDGAASFDVRLVQDGDDFRRLVHDHRRRDYGRGVQARRQLLLEERLLGPVVSAEGFALPGSVEVFGFTDRIMGPEPGFVEVGLRFDEGEPFPGAASYVQEVLAAAGHTWGPFHLEFALTPTGPRVIEINARFVGAGMQHGLALTRPLSWARSHLLPALLGEAPEMVASGPAVVELQFGSPVGGRLLDVTGLPDRLEGTDVLGVGSFLTPPCDVSTTMTSNGDCLGFVLAHGADRDAAQASATTVLQAVRLTVEDDRGGVSRRPPRLS
ncbi:ATP-grasp domain-containing protein [Frigoribacterium salinisoli]